MQRRSFVVAAALEYGVRPTIITNNSAPTIEEPWQSWWRLACSTSCTPRILHSRCSECGAVAACRVHRIAEKETPVSRAAVGNPRIAMHLAAARATQRCVTAARCVAAGRVSSATRAAGAVRTQATRSVRTPATGAGSATAPAPSGTRYVGLCRRVAG